MHDSPANTREGKLQSLRAQRRATDCEGDYDLFLARNLKKVEKVDRFAVPVCEKTRQPHLRRAVNVDACLQRAAAQHKSSSRRRRRRYKHYEGQ